MNETLARLANQFQRFGECECVPASPLYAQLAVGVAQDEQLLALASRAQAGPVPNLLFGAVQYLLLSGVAYPLAAYYPSLYAMPLDLARSDPFPSFRNFCFHHAEAIISLLATRRVQTNEVRRCACLLPVFHVVAEHGGKRPLALVEIGASAGLNLLWDKYYFDYGGQSGGSPISSVRLHCELRHSIHLPLGERTPEIAYRIGIDLNPIDVNDEAAMLWLRALIWPEQRNRVAYLEQAVRLAQAQPPLLRKGDAVALLPEVLAQIPPQATLCLYHTFVLNQFPHAARERFHQLLDAHATTRDFFVVGIEWQEPAPRLVLTTYAGGVRSEQMLATCGAHGEWLDWMSSYIALP